MVIVLHLCYRLFKLCDIPTLSAVLVFYTYHCHGNIKHYLRLRNTTSNKFLLLDSSFHEQEEGIFMFYTNYWHYLVVLATKYGIPLSKCTQFDQQTLVGSPVRYCSDLPSDDYWTTW